MNPTKLNNAVNAMVKCFEELHKYPGPDEIFKWVAVDNFQANWDLDAADKSEMVKKSFSDNSSALFRGMPFVVEGLRKILSNDEDCKIVKDACAKLFAAADIDSSLKLNAILEFKDTINNLAAKYSKNGAMYMWDVRFIMNLLAFYSPSNNYLYKSSEVKDFFNYIGADTKLGSNENFDIKKYYEICDAIRTALLANKELQKLYADGKKERGVKCDDQGYIQVYDLINAYKYPFFKKALYDNLEELQIQYNETLNNWQARLEELKAVKIELPNITNMEIEHIKWGKGVITGFKRKNTEINYVITQFPDGEHLFKFCDLGVFYKIDNLDFNIVCDTRKELELEIEEVNTNIANIQREITALKSIM